MHVTLGVKKKIDAIFESAQTLQTNKRFSGSARSRRWRRSASSRPA